MRKHFLTILPLFCVCLLFAQTNQVEIRPLPTWVYESTWSDSVAPPPEASGGFYYRLVDRQTHVPKQARFTRVVVEITHSDGIQTLSDISKDFDPAYQELVFHRVRIHRNGTVIDKLADHRFQLLQRESSMERNLYDGALTAFMNLSDVRKGDVLEYAYTVEGQNPLFQGAYFQRFWFQYTFPVERLHTRLLADAGTRLYLKSSEQAPTPSKKQLGKLTEWRWDLHDLPYLLEEEQTPSWYDPFPRVDISSYDTWNQVVQWALPMYRFQPNRLDQLAQKTSEEFSLGPDAPLPERIRQRIAFVQDDIRYLGFEGGIQGYQPSDPQAVLARRYGDCKDKSFLLASLLQDIGVEAYPMLVHSGAYQSLRERLPSPVAFDHCVVQYEWEGRNYFVDPTISGQGGNIVHRYFPDYGYGLILRPGETELTALPQPSQGETRIEVVLKVDSMMRGSGKLSIKTTYIGKQADRLRDQFVQSSLAEVEKEYLNFYVDHYPGIRVDSPLVVLDLGHRDTNVFEVEEHYVVPEIWKYDEEEQVYYIGMNPVELYASLSYDAPADRTMPFWIGYQPNVISEMVLIMPEWWDGSGETNEVETEQFRFANEFRIEQDSVFLRSEYERAGTHLTPEDIEDFVAKHDSILSEINFYVYYESPRLSDRVFAGDRGALMTFFLALLGGLGLAIKLHQWYDP